MTFVRFLAFSAALLALSITGYSAYGQEETRKVETRVFEMRVYYANPGKMQALHARFRDHTNKLFVKHGMTLIGYWSPIDPKDSEERLIYILAYPSKEAAAKSWDAFQKDPVWLEAKANSEKKGVLVKKVDSIYLNPTDYSPIK
ncbi:MAG: NIPSNAP family protein [Planctomycetes bacterium]|nr:NIPSNAP family protein [Planctomycetota bacterium]